MDPLYVSIVAVSAGMAAMGASIIMVVACVRRCPRPATNPTVVTVLDWKNPSTS